MKKILLLGLIGLIGLMGREANAQFGDYGVRFGVGPATIDDDLTTKSGILGVVAGGYINYTFTATESAIADILYLQSGLNLIRRGSTFEEVLETGTNLMHREGFIHAWYAQIPILACIHFELPIRQAGHTVGFFLGPTIGIGLFGPYNERKVTPFVSALEANYDLTVNGTASDRAVFNHLNRFDFSAILGLTYERGPFTASVYLDRGFLATSTGEDVLRIMERNQTDNEEINVKIPNGNNLAYMFCLSYRLGTLINNKK